MPEPAYLDIDQQQWPFTQRFLAVITADGLSTFYGGLSVSVGSSTTSSDWLNLGNWTFSGIVDLTGSALQIPATLNISPYFYQPLAASGSWPTVGAGADPPAANEMGKVTKTAQAAAIASTLITNGLAAGLYEVSFYLSCTTANALDGTITFQVSYTDRVGATTQVTPTTLTLAATSTGTTALKGTFVVYLASGDISYQTNLTGAQTTSRYSLDARCVYLG